MNGALLAYWTCSDAAAGIFAEGFIRPKPQPLLGGFELVWLTDLWDMDESARLALGLTSASLTCDRTEYRFAVRPNSWVQHWPDWAHRHKVSMRVRDMLDGAPGAQPRRWWVVDQPIRPQSAGTERFDWNAA